MLDQLRRQVGVLSVTIATSLMAAAAYPPAALNSRRLAKALVTGATASSAPTSPTCSPSEATRWLGVEEGSPDARSRTSTRARELDVRDRRAVRRALKGAERVFHCAGVTSVRPQDAERLFEVNVGGTKL